VNPRQDASQPVSARYEPGSGQAGSNFVAPRHDLARPAQRDTLLDVLDRVLDKGVVIAGDICISLLDIELLTIKIRLLIASADKAREMGIDWWAHDPQLSSSARRQREKLDSDEETKKLRERVKQLEDRLAALPDNRGQARPRTRDSQSPRHAQPAR